MLTTCYTQCGTQRFKLTQRCHASYYEILSTLCEYVLLTHVYVLSTNPFIYAWAYINMLMLVVFVFSISSLRLCGLTWIYTICLHLINSVQQAYCKLLANVCAKWLQCFSMSKLCSIQYWFVCLFFVTSHTWLWSYWWHLANYWWR